MNWQTLIETVTSATVVVAAVAWVLRSFFLHWLKFDIEKYKKDLALEREKEVQKLVADLRMAAFEHETKFAGAYGRRVSVIADLYGKLYHTYADFGKQVGTTPSGRPSDGETYKTAAASLEAFNACFRENRLYFEEEICLQIERFLEKMEDAQDKWMKEFMARLGEVTPDEDDYWKRGKRDFDKEAKSVFSAIENSFRSIVGIKSQISDSQSRTGSST